MATETLERKLAQFPLSVTAHVAHNLVGSVGAVAASVLPYVLLEYHLADWLFVLPTFITASIAEDGVRSATAMTKDWPFAEIRVLGWLVVPGIFLCIGIRLDHVTKEKLYSTRTVHMEHLDHEAKVAVEGMTSQNLTRVGALKIADTLIQLEPRKWYARRTFILHEHDLGWAGFWPWLIALILASTALGCALYFALQALTPEQPYWANGSSLMLGWFIVFFTFGIKTRRYRRMRLPRQIRLIYRSAARSQQTAGGTI